MSVMLTVIVVMQQRPCVLLRDANSKKKVATDLVSLHLHQNKQALCTSQVFYCTADTEAPLVYGRLPQFALHSHLEWWTMN